MIEISIKGLAQCFCLSLNMDMDMDMYIVERNGYLQRHFISRNTLLRFRDDAMYLWKVATA
jgi:hypothetical protein